MKIEEMTEEVTSISMVTKDTATIRVIENKLVK
jgi:hypothetical protein